MSEVRRRSRQINVRLLPDEYTAVHAAAKREGVSPSEILRRAVVKQGNAEELKQTIRISVGGVAHSNKQLEEIVSNVFQAVYPRIRTEDRR